MDAPVSIPPPPPPPPPPFFAETSTSQLAQLPPPPAPALPQAATSTVTASVTSPPTQDRIWLHPWTVNEMRGNASQWSLAGDAGLLLYLEQFSERLVQRADAIHQHLNQTVNAVKSTHTRVQNCLNEFTSLANTQFIENRVYDEDETATTTKTDETSTEKANVSNAEAQEKVLQRYVEAVQYGLAILDTHFERVDPKLDTIQNGASSYIDDDEDGGVPIEPILEPKDPYIYRPLPYLIGTTEFLQDDYVGLGDLLNVPDEDGYGVDQNKMESDSALSSSDEDDEDDFQAPVSSVPIVPAGASRPDAANQVRQPAATVLTDSENDDDDDPFKSKAAPFDFSTSTKQDAEDDFGIKPKGPVQSKPYEADQESDDGGEEIFGIPKAKRDVESNKNRDFDNNSTTSEEPDEPEEEKPAATSAGPTRHLSALEEAVMRRRIAMGDPDVPPEVVKSIMEKPAKTSKESTPTTATKSSSETSATPATTTASKSSTAGAPTTAKAPASSIFGTAIQEDNDDDDDFFSDAPKQSLFSNVEKPTSTKPEVKSVLQKLPTKSTKGLFDDASDDDDPFSTKNRAAPSSAKAKPADPISKPAATGLLKPNPPVGDSDSDEDDILLPRKLPSKPTTMPTPAVTETRKVQTPSFGDDDLFSAPALTKPKTTLTKPEVSDDDDFLSTPKPAKQPLPTQQQLVAPLISPAPPTTVTAPSSKKPLNFSNDDSEEELFGISKSKEPKTTAPPVVSPVDDDDDMFGISTAKSKVAIAELPEVVSPPLKPPSGQDKLSGSSKASAVETPKTMSITPKVIDDHDDDDDDDGLFGIKKAKTNPPRTDSPKPIPAQADEEKKLIPTKPLQVPLPPPVQLPPLPSPPSAESDLFDDPLLGIRKTPESAVKSSPAEPSKPHSVPSVPTTKKALSDSEDEDLFSKRPTNPAALKEGEKRSVKDLAKSMVINPMAHKPGSRPKPPPPAEEPSSPPLDDEPPPASVVKEKPKAVLDTDDDDDDLFKTTKKTTSVTEPKEKVTSPNENKGVSVKDLSGRLKIPIRPVSGALPKVMRNEENVSNDTTFPIATETSKDEPVADKTMLDILKDRAKLSVKTRTPPTRKPRSTGAAAVSAANETDDLFALPSSSNTIASPSAAPPVVAAPSSPVPPPPVVTSPVVPPPVPATGLPDNTATATAALAEKQSHVKEKKKISLFDSDDSDADELLFGSKNKSSPAVKPAAPSTTPKASTKPSILSLDDDDNDFLSKRPAKKPTKTFYNDDIFADVQDKAQPGNKAKKDWSIMNNTGTDDTFNDASGKSPNAAKAKATSAKSKSSKDFDDIFDDPLNVASKR